MQAQRAVETKGSRYLDIPIMAALAAAEVDSLVKNKDSGTENLMLLAGFLNLGAESIRAGGDKVGGIGKLSTVCAISKTFDKLNGTPSTSLQHLRIRTAELVEKLNGIERNPTGQEKKFLSELREFCMALANCVMAAERNFRDSYTIDELKNGS